MKGFRLKGLDPVFFMSHLLFLIFSYSIYLAPDIAPSTFPYFGFIPIFYPLIILTNILLLIVLFWRRTLYGVIFTLASIGLLFPLTKTYQYFGKTVEAKADFKVLSFNAQYLREKGYIDFFNKEKADLVLLQEVYWKDESFMNLKDSAFADYYHESNSIIQFFSKYPIIEFKKIFSGENGTSGYAAYADLDIGHDTIRVINVYLESMLIDKELVKETIGDHQKTKKNSQILKNKLTKGFLRHEKQIKELLPYINSSPHPVILAGDLNSVPNSYEYQQLAYLINDTYYVVGKSAGTSFHDFKYPLRLDYIFYSDEFLPVKYEVLKKIKLSDHYPVVGYFKIP